MCLINNKREWRGLLNPGPPPSRLARLFREVWRHVNYPCPFQLRERKKERSDVDVARPKHRPKPVRPWLDPPDAKKYRQRKRKRPPPPPTTDSRARQQRRETPIQLVIWPVQPLPSSLCFVFFLHTVSRRLFCFDGHLVCNYFKLFFLIARQLTRNIYVLSVIFFLCVQRADFFVIFTPLHFYYGQYSYSDGLTVPPTLVHRESCLAYWTVLTTSNCNGIFRYKYFFKELRNSS